MNDQQTSDGSAGAGTQESDEQSALKRFASLMTSVFMPIIPPLIGAGIIQGLLSILTGFGLLSDQSTEYYVLNLIGSAIFYFLPFLLAVSSARAFKTNPFMAIGLAALLLHPDTTAIMQTPEPVEFLGIPIAQTQYTSSVIPIILIVWVMSLLSRWLNRHIPELLGQILVPTIVMLVMGLLSLMVLGPLGQIVASALTGVVSFLSGQWPWLVPTLIGATGAILIAVGASFALLPLAIASVTELGYQTVHGPGMLAVNFSLTGMCIAVAMGTKNQTYKGYSLSAALTAGMGVAQPALYGVAIPLLKPLIATCIGGLAGGLVAGLTGFRVYGMVPPGVAAIPAMVGPDGLGNLLRGIAVMVVALVVGFLATRLIGFSEPSAETVSEIAEDDEDDADEEGADKSDTDDGRRG